MLQHDSGPPARAVVIVSVRAAGRGHLAPATSPRAAALARSRPGRRSRPGYHRPRPLTRASVTPGRRGSGSIGSAISRSSANAARSFVARLTAVLLTADPLVTPGPGRSVLAVPVAPFTLPGVGRACATPPARGRRDNAPVPYRPPDDAGSPAVGWKRLTGRTGVA